ncbi:hypothetical protein WT63_16410 [Burkholderia anthina]|nr:hypothetical protein WT63_16410 [Burkholderia anthina]
MELRKIRICKVREDGTLAELQRKVSEDRTDCFPELRVFQVTRSHAYPELECLVRGQNTLYGSNQFWTQFVGSYERNRPDMERLGAGEDRGQPLFALCRPTFGNEIREINECRPAEPVTAQETAHVGYAITRVEEPVLRRIATIGRRRNDKSRQHVPGDPVVKLPYASKLASL